MPADAPKLARWKIVAGYAGFTLFALVVCLYLTFPYDAVKQRVTGLATAANLQLTIGSLGPGLFGVTARNVRVNRVLTPEQRRLASETGTPDPTPLEIESIAVRPALLPPGLAVRANLLGGVVTGSVGVLGSTRISVSGSKLDLSRGNIEGFTGVKLSGLAELDADLALPTSSEPGKPAEPDLGQASGKVKLVAKDLSVNGGHVGVQDLPKVPLGGLEARIAFDKGMGTIETLGTKSAELEAGGTGTLKLAKRFEYSNVSLDVRLKADAEYIKTQSLLGMGLAFLPADPEAGWRAFKIRGYLGRPEFPDFRRR